MLLGSRLIAAALFIAMLPKPVSSDEESSPYPYITLAKGGGFYFKMLPDSTSQFPFDRDSGFGTAYRVTFNNCDEKIWSVEGWYAFSTCLTRDGQYLVRLGNWPRGDGPSHDDLAVAFYQSGKLLKAYSTRDLIVDDSKVEISVSHYEFLKGTPCFSEQSGYFFELETIDGVRYTFDVRNGKIKSKHKP